MDKQIDKFSFAKDDVLLLTGGWDSESIKDFADACTEKTIQI